jgi:ribosomal protein S4
VTTTGENENFGEILVGDRIISHPGYKVRPGFLVLRI